MRKKNNKKKQPSHSARTSHQKECHPCNTRDHIRSRSHPLFWYDYQRSLVTMRQKSQAVRRYSETKERGTIAQQMQEIRLELDLNMATDTAQSWLGFLDDETPWEGRDGMVDSTSGVVDRRGEEGWRQIKETKRCWAGRGGRSGAFVWE